MKISRSSKIGILITVTFIIFIWGFNYLKGRNLISLEELYYVRYENIKGLQESAEVTINGYRVGQVSSIEFDGDLSGELIVTISLNEDFKLPKGTVARIASKDFMGTMIIKLELGDQNDVHSPNDTILGGTETALIDLVGDELSPLKDKTEKIMIRLDTTILALNQVLNKDNRDAFSSTMQDLKNTMNSVRSISKELDGQKENITGVVENFKSFSDSLSVIEWNQLSTQAEQSLGNLNEILNDAQNEEGSLGKFLKDSMLYSNVNSTVLQLDRLITNVEANPKKYLKFSAVDWGKDYYIVSEQEKALGKEIHFAVKLFESQVPVSVHDSRFKSINKLKEYSEGRHYYYLEDEIRTPDEAILRCDELRKYFPGAEIWAFRKGKHVKLEKVLKRLE